MSRSLGALWAGVTCMTVFGCAEPIQLQARAPAGGFYPISFWPPPEPTSLWLSEPSGPGACGLSFGAAYRRIDLALRRAGYTQTRIYSIGARFEHGLAMSTTLERIDDYGVAFSAPNRWVPEFKDPATLIWLRQARRLPVGTRGRYRTYLLALTDLGLTQEADRATIWNDHTWMGEMDNSVERFPSSQLIPSRYRLGAYVYEYEARRRESRASFVPSQDERIPPANHAAALGIVTALCSSADD